MHADIVWKSMFSNCLPTYQHFYRCIIICLLHYTAQLKEILTEEEYTVTQIEEVPACGANLHWGLLEMVMYIKMMYM
jgi:hypothetical protein